MTKSELNALNSETGPKIFLKRLAEHSDGLSDVMICNPDSESVKLAKGFDGTIIGRLDGTSYYDFVKENLQNFLLLRNKKLAFHFSKVIPAFACNSSVTKFLNRHLDRNSLWLMHNADGLIFQSQLSRKMHEKFLNFVPEQKKHTIILNGVNVDEYHPTTQIKSNDKEINIIVSASKYRVHKRLNEAIKLVNHLALNINNIRLHVLGEIDYITSQSIKKLDKTRCIFHGRVHPSQLPSFYRMADVQLHLSIFDPCPNVVAEGLASGLPVVTPVESGAYELIGNENSNWAIHEGLDLKYRKLHVVQEIPNIDLTMYSKVIIKILENLNFHKNQARRRAVQELDIKCVSTKYAEFIDEIKKK